MAITKNETFVTSDGHVFSTYAEATQYESLLGKAQQIQGILDAYQDTLDSAHNNEWYTDEASMFEEMTQHLAVFIAKHIGDVK